MKPRPISDCRVAVTSAAVLTLTADQQPAPAIVSQQR